MPALPPTNHVPPVGAVVVAGVPTVFNTRPFAALPGLVGAGVLGASGRELERYTIWYSTEPSRPWAVGAVCCHTSSRCKPATWACEIKVDARSMTARNTRMNAERCRYMGASIVAKTSKTRY